MLPVPRVPDGHTINRHTDVARHVSTDPIMPGNGYVESFNGKLRDELLNMEEFSTLREAQILIEQWRRHYNEERPHSSLGYRPPAPEVLRADHVPRPSGSGSGGAAQIAGRVIH